MLLASILFLRSWTTFTFISVIYFLDKLLLSSSFSCSQRYLSCYFISTYSFVISFFPACCLLSPFCRFPVAVPLASGVSFLVGVWSLKRLTPLSSWYELDLSWKQQNDLCSFPAQTVQYWVIQACAPATNAEEAEVEQFSEDLQDLLELTPKKDVLFIKGDWNAKVGNQEIPGLTNKFGLGVQNEAGKRLIEFCQKNTLLIANTLFQQHKRRLYTWTSPDGRHRNQIDYILCSQRWRSSIQSAKQDWELTVAQIMNSSLPNSDWNWRK